MDTDCKFCDSLIPLSRWIIARRGCFTGSRDRFERLCSLGRRQVEKAADSNVAVKLPLFLRRQLPLLVLDGQFVHLFPVFFGKAQVEQGSRGLRRQGELASLDYS